MAPRIKDIAELANVSITTVSLVLNDKGSVGQETRERVLRVAESIQYEKKLGASSKSERKDPATIAFVKIVRHGHTVNRDHNVFISDYIDGIVECARAHNYKTEIMSFEATPIEDLPGSLNTEHNLSGAVVLGTELSRSDIFEFTRANIPVVFIDTFMNFLPFDFIDMNNEDSVYSAVDYFLQRGHRKIGMIRSSVPTRNFELRHSAFRRALEFFDLPLDERHVYDCDSTFQGAYTDMLRALEAETELPTALFCTNDIIAFGVLKALKQSGYRVPEDVSLIGFDDLPSATLMNPPLSSIAVSKQEIGRVAMARLKERIADPGKPVAQIAIGGALVERSSVKQLYESSSSSAATPHQPH